MISCRSPSISKKQKVWQWSGQKTPKVGRVEFLSRRKTVSPLGNQWNGPTSSFAWSDSPVNGMNASEDRGGSKGSQPDFYSTFHKTPNGKKFTKNEWEEFTEESTRESVAELAASPEFMNWVMKNPNRINLLPGQMISVGQILMMSIQSIDTLGIKLAQLDTRSLLGFKRKKY